MLYYQKSKAKKVISGLIHATLALLLSTEAVANSAGNPAKVMMLGTFHFSSPGKDKVKVKHTNVLTAENQHYLAGLSARIAEQFQPTHVLLECDPKSQAIFEQRFDDYLKGEYELPVNEVYQLGFRIAGASKGAKVICFDERNTPWQAEQLFEDLKGNEVLNAGMQTMYAKMTEDGNQRHANNTLPEILTIMNTESLDKNNKYSYLYTNEIGAFGNFSGADAAASWWHRNFRMYANIQHHAQPGTRVFVIAGQGHTAIMKDLLADDIRREAVDIKAFL